VGKYIKRAETIPRHTNYCGLEAEKLREAGKVAFLEVMSETVKGFHRTLERWNHDKADNAVKAVHPDLNPNPNTNRDRKLSHNWLIFSRL